MLSAADKDFYQSNGYLLVEDAISADQLATLRQITLDWIDEARGITESDSRFDLDLGHSAETPRLTRVKLPHRQHPAFWDVLVNSRMTQVLTDLIGPDTIIQTTKLNTKAPGGGAAVEWHQDWAFYPHTNDDMLAFGLMLDDVDQANGPLQVIPGSHKGPVLAHTNADGIFCGAIDPDDPDFHSDQAVTLTGKAGSMTVHHVRMLHGSAPNVSDRNRLICFYELRAADAWPLVGNGSYLGNAIANQQDLLAVMEEGLVTGRMTLTPRMEACPVRLPLPPAPVGGSIFQTQRSGGAKSVFAA